MFGTKEENKVKSKGIEHIWACNDCKEYGKDKYLNKEVKQ